MNDRTKFHLQSLVFAGIVLLFALLPSLSQPTTSVSRGQMETVVTPRLTATALATVGEDSLPALTKPAEPALPLIPAESTGGDVAAVESQSQVAPEPPAVSVQAVSGLVTELNSDAPIFSYHADYRWPLASLTKLMTAVIAYETIGPDQAITISEEAMTSEGVAGGFSAGEMFTVHDLVKTMILNSSNKAATAVADYMGTEKFIDLMQQKAASLGMENSVYIDPTGLSYLNQSTAEDIEKLVAYVEKIYPEILAFARATQGVIVERNSGLSRTLFSINKFSGRSDFLGGKTGFTEEAKENLASLFSYNGKKYLIIVLGSDDRFKETQKLYDWLKQQ